MGCTLPENNVKGLLWGNKQMKTGCKRLVKLLFVYHINIL